jgi:hypothetical protein
MAAETAEAIPPPCRRPPSPAAAVDDAEFREFVRVFNDWTADAIPEPIALVIDAGRFHWKAGDAGEDSPSIVVPEGVDGVRLGVELQRLRSDGSDRSRQTGLQLLREHRETCCASVIESLSLNVERGQARPYELALVTVPLLERPDDPDSQAAWLIRQLFERIPSLRGITLQNQEVLSSYATGQGTALVINLGSELSVVAMWEGYLLSDTASVVGNPQYDLLPSSVQNSKAMEHWLETSGLVDAVEEAITAAPRDTRKDLLFNIVIAGGMRAHWGMAGQACAVHLPSALLRRLASTGHLRSNPPGVGRVAEQPIDRFVRVVSPPERDCSAWIGGSIGCSLNATFRSPDPVFISRERHDAFVALGTQATAADASCLLGAAERTLVPVSPDLRPAAAWRALAWARCLLHSDASWSTELADLPIELVVRIGELLVHPPAPRGATTPPEESCRTDAELALLMAPRLQGCEQGQDCEPQYWTEAGAERVARARYIGRSTVQPPPQGGLSLLERDHDSWRIRVMLS